MRVTPLDIEQHRFKVRFRGFDRKEVTVFLELISNEIEDLIGENNALKEDLGEKDDILNAHKEREKHISESIVASQKIAEDMKLNA